MSRCRIGHSPDPWEHRRPDPRETDPLYVALSLDTAWKEAEAALPDGWKMLVGRETVTPFSYWATASGPFDDETRTYPIVSTSRNGTLEATPAAALRALAAALRDKP